MQTGFWYRFVGGSDISDRESEILEPARAVGLDLFQFNSKKPSGPGLVFFNEVNQELCSFLAEISRNGIERVIAVSISNFAIDGDSIWTLLQAGASDLVIWEDSLDWRGVKERLDRWSSVADILESPLIRNNLVGQSVAWRVVLREVIEVACFTNAPVLVMGESGTGKELVARLIHTLDPRPDKGKLVVVDCAAIVPELSGSEFFGHENGAFTGAVVARDGAFSLANGGTLFLDEVGELPLSLQAQLLRAVEEHTYKRLGSNTWQHTEFRLVCATNKDLLKELDSGKFRRDLYYRIAGWICRLPSLRERPEDILPLARHFVREAWADGQPPELDKSVCHYLLSRDYPGNVRDLKQLILRIRYFHADSGPITIGDIPREELALMDSGSREWRDEHFEHSIRRALSLGIGLKEIRRGTEETTVEIAVAEEDTLKRAASKLGITERALQMRRAAARSQSEDDKIAHMDIERPKLKSVN